MLLRCNLISAQAPKCEVTARATAQSATGRVYRNKDINKLFQKNSTRTWRGYAGIWHADLNDPSTFRELHAIRVWRWRDEARRVLDQTNVYTGPRPGATQRTVDGLWQKDFVYQGPVFDPEHQEVPVGASRPALLALDPHCHLFLSSFRLPGMTSGEEGPSKAADGPLGRPGAAGPGAWEQLGNPPPPAPAASSVSSPPPPPPPSSPLGEAAWGFEAFLKDGEHRWSVAITYDTVTRKLQRVTFIQEHEITVDDPTVADVLTACRGVVRAPRGQLGTDPTGWVARGSVGRRVSRVWPAPGFQELMRDDALPDDEVDWTPPRGDSSNTNSSLSAPAGAATPREDTFFVRLPDAMYVRLPTTLPQPEPAAGAQVPRPGDDVRQRMCVFEFGGRMCEPGAADGGRGVWAGSGDGLVQRVVLRFGAATGAFVDASREVFAAEASPL